MSKVTLLPGRRALTLPVARGASVRLTPFEDSEHVLLELRGPQGGDLGALVLHADNARLVADGLMRVADGCDAAEAPGVPARAAEVRRPARADATSLLTATLDPEATLASFARLAVPVFADWCTVDVADAGQLPRRLTVIHADTSRRKAADTLARYPHDPGMKHPRSAVWATGKPDLAPEVPDARLVAAAHSAEHLAVLRTLGCRSSLAVPLVVGGRVFGVVTFALAESRRRYTEAELPLAVTLVRCAAIAAENARLYREAHETLRSRIGTAPARQPQRRGPIRDGESGTDPQRRQR